MTEVEVTQRSTEWFELRKSVTLTASCFGDAIGIGRGKPYDFLLSLLNKDTENEQDTENEHTRHGVELEPVIDEAYQLLTGYKTEESGFWLPAKSNILHGLIGASPDGKVIIPGLEGKDGGGFSGLVEYKAPVHKMYDVKSHAPHGIPRSYMAQIQGQMAVCGAKWCDFMAVCVNTREIMLKRVYFHHQYWTGVAGKIKDFCLVLQEARKRKSMKLDPVDFPAARRLKTQQVVHYFFPGEPYIFKENLLHLRGSNEFRSKSGMWLKFDFLLGNAYEVPRGLVEYRNHIFQRIDEQIDKEEEES